jgi:hypothetical protein
VLGVTSHTWKCMFVIHVLLSYLNILQFVSLSLGIYVLNLTHRNHPKVCNSRLVSHCHA